VRPLPQERDEGGGRAGQRAISAIDESSRARDHFRDRNQLHSPAGLHCVPKLALISDTQDPRDKALDHAHTVSSIVIFSCVRTAEMLVQQLPGEAGARKNQRLRGNIFMRTVLTLPGIARIDISITPSRKNRMDFQARDVRRKRTIPMSTFHLPFLQHLWLKLR